MTRYFQLGVACAATGEYNAAITALTRALSTFETSLVATGEDVGEVGTDPHHILGSRGRGLKYLMERAKSYQLAGNMAAVRG